MNTTRILNRQTRRSRRLCAMAWLLLTFLFAPASQSLADADGQSAIVDLSAYEGRWQRIDDGATEAARFSAIDAAIAKLSWIVREMASGVLRKTTTPPPELQFAWDGRQLYQGLQGEDGAATRAIDLDGKFLTLKDPRGVEYASAWVWTGSGLRVRWEQHQATGSNVYRIDERDHSLIVEHTIEVTAIAGIDPIVYRSRFALTEPPARAAIGLGDGQHATTD